MYKENDYLVYKKDVCKVREVRKNRMNGKDYYILVPITDESLIIEAPADNRMGFIRDVISKEEAEKLIKKIPKIETLENLDDKYIEKTYKELLYNGDLEDLIKIIKTTYIRNDNRIKSNKKISDKDKTYFEKAEEYLYNELSISLNMSFGETKEYIINEVTKLINK